MTASGSRKIQMVSNLLRGEHFSLQNFIHSVITWGVNSGKLLGFRALHFDPPVVGRSVCTLTGGPWSHAPNNQSTFLGGFTPKTMIISITRGVVSENSSDLSSGRRPQSKSVEFFETTPLEIEIRTLQSYSFFRKGDPFFGASLQWAFT